jgi:hypothetical protein
MTLIPTLTSLPLVPAATPVWVGGWVGMYVCVCVCVYRGGGGGCVDVGV